MNRQRLQNRTGWAMNVAARSLGETTDLYRPDGPRDPLAPANRILRLHAAFMPRRGRAESANGYGYPVWLGVFDAAYTKPGDYLVQDRRTCFIASQSGLAEPICVETNRRISIARRVPTAIFGVDGSTNAGADTVEHLITDWPASVLGIESRGTHPTNLPSDVGVPQLTILLPPTDRASFRVSDLYSDDLGRTATIVAAEQSTLGWRLVARQVGV